MFVPAAAGVRLILVSLSGDTLAGHRCAEWMHSGDDPTGDLLTGRSEIVVLRWPSYEDALSDTTSPTVYKSDFGSIRFERDGELFVLAYVSESTEPSEMPLPPQQRFEAAAKVGGQIEWMPAS